MTSPSPLVAWATVDDLPAATATMHAPAQWASFLDTATAVLWAASGRRWRGSSVGVEAVLRAAPPRASGSWLYHSSWGHCACYAGASAWGPRWADARYSHESPTRVRLPHSDVTDVSAVTIDGVAFTDFERDGNWVERTDGAGWPMCRDRVVITYSHGLEPPLAGRGACVTLAVELGRDAAGEDADQPCQLPKRLQSVSRQGLTFEQVSELDKFEFLDKGLTGLYSVDVWLKAVNPKGRARVGSVWSPDTRKARKRN